MINFKKMVMQRTRSSNKKQYETSCRGIIKFATGGVLLGLLCGVVPASAESLKASWKDGIRFGSKSKEIQLKLGGRIQNDWSFMSVDSSLPSNPDGTFFRRARLYLAGTLFQNLDFKAQYDFSDSANPAQMKDMYMRIKNVPFIGNIRVGHFNEPFSLALLTSSKYIPFVERALPAAFAPSRNTGIMLEDQSMSRRFTYSLGLFIDSDKYGRSIDGADISLTGRLTAALWHDENYRTYKKGERNILETNLFHVGVAYSRREPAGVYSVKSKPETALAESFVSASISDVKNVDLLGLEMALVYKNLSLQGEYIVSKVNKPGKNARLDGYYAMASYFLTGENRPYKNGSFSRVKPINPYRRGGWGAWEALIRFSDLNLNDPGASVAGGELRDYTVGLNWYLYNNFRIMSNFVYADVKEMGKAQLFTTRFAVDF